MPLCSQFVASWQRSPWNDHDGVPGWASNQRKTRYTIYHERYFPRWFNERTADRRSKESSPPFRSFRLSNLCRKKIQARTFSPRDVSGNGMKREWFSLSSHLPVRVWRSCFALVLIASLSSLSFTTFGWLPRRLLESLEEFRSSHATFVFSSPSRLLLAAFVFIESGYFLWKRGRYIEVGKLISLEGTERYWLFIDGNLGR